MTTPLSNLLIVESCGDVATRYCGKLFVEHGARVVQCFTPDDSRVGRGGEATRAYAAWLDDGKQRATQWPAGANVVIAGQSPGDVAQAELMRAALAPQSMLLALTWLGIRGPRAHWHASDGTIQAMSGVAYGFGPVDEVPVLAQGHAPQVVAGATAFIATMAALLGRDRGHPCGRIDVSVLEAFLCLTDPAPAAFAQNGTPSLRGGLNRFQGVYPQTIYRAADGWIGVTALTPPQWQSLCEMVGLPQVGHDPAFATSDLRFNASAAVDALLGPALLARRRADLLEEGQRRRIPLAPVPSLAEVFETPHWRERGSFRSFRGAGAPFEGPAAPFRVHRHANAKAGREAPDTSKSPGPLAGVRVLDLSMGWSGPLAGRHLADLGADVIKVESCAHIDWWRGWDALQDGDPPPHETQAIFNANNRNKRGITVDLRNPRGLALMRQLAAKSDVLIENFAPGVLDRLGLSASVLAEVAPQLVYVSMGAFGNAGPWSGFRAYGSTTEQASGFPTLNGEAHWPPSMQHGAFGDPIAGIYAAIASLVGLHGQRASGGARMDLSQVECLFQLGADGLVAQSATGITPQRTGSRNPTSAWRGVVRCADDQTWVAIDIIDNATLAQRLGTVGVQWPAKEMVDDQAALSDSQITAALGAWAGQLSPSQACEALQRAGIAAGEVVAPHALLEDAHLRATGFWLSAQRRYVGTHVLPKAPYEIDGQALSIHCPAPTLGERNAEVLSQVLGLSADEIDALEREGIIGTRPV